MHENVVELLHDACYGNVRHHLHLVPVQLVMQGHGR